MCDISIQKNTNSTFQTNTKSFRFNSKQFILYAIHCTNICMSPAHTDIYICVYVYVHAAQ